MKRKIVATRFVIAVAILTLILCVRESMAQDSRAGAAALDILAAQMAPKTWAELQTLGFTWENIHISPNFVTAPSNIFAYSDDAVWDPNTMQLLFLGAGHYSAWKFVAYSAETNAWNVLPVPAFISCMTSENNPWCVGHAYDNNAINPAQGYLYHHLSNTLSIHRYDIAGQYWTQLPSLPGSASVTHGTALEYFPEMGGLIRVRSGKVHFLSDGATGWTLLHEVPMGNYHNIAEYSPVHKVMLLGGGNNGLRQIYRLDGQGRITALNPAPVDIGTHFSMLTLDPVTGTFLVISVAGEFYAFDVMKDRWELLAASVPWSSDPTQTVNRTVATPISTHGVTMFVKGWDYEDGQVFLYKHASTATIQVGPGKPYTTPSSAATVAQDGDVIAIDAGTYTGDVAVWNADHLTIRGVGGLVNLQANDASAEGKGTWVIKGNYTTVENVEFSGARVAGHNAAGIRLEGAGLTVRNCYFHDNDNGILGGGDSTSTIVVENSEFTENGFGDGRSHNVHINDAAGSFMLRFSYLHQTNLGHHVSSRARENYILYNRITDEVGGTSKHLVNLPAGGSSYLIGNLLQQSVSSDPATLVSYGAEGWRHPMHDLYIVNNTFVSDRSAGRFIFVRSDATPAKITNNLFVGAGRVADGPVVRTTNLITNNPGLISINEFDYRPSSLSPCINKGSNPGSANGFDLNPAYQYVHKANAEKRSSISTIDIGAYEYRVLSLVEEGLDGGPRKFSLEQNYPNPFNPSTSIRFSLPERAHVTLKVFDVQGHELAELANGMFNAGEHSVVFDMRNSGATLSSGVYFYRLQALNHVQQKKMIIFK
ncbi:MAG: T9SS type A sorting domain-containing protein [bacterium]